MAKLGPIQQAVRQELNKQKLNEMDNNLVKNEYLTDLFTEDVPTKPKTLSELFKAEDARYYGKANIENDVILGQIIQPVSGSVAVSVSSDGALNHRNTIPTHVLFTTTDGDKMLVVKDKIDEVLFDTHKGQAEVIIDGYEDVWINEKEFIKLCGALT